MMNTKKMSKSVDWIKDFYNDEVDKDDSKITTTQIKKELQEIREDLTDLKLDMRGLKESANRTNKIILELQEQNNKLIELMEGDK